MNLDGSPIVQMKLPLGYMKLAAALLPSIGPRRTSQDTLKLALAGDGHSILPASLNPHNT